MSSRAKNLAGLSRAQVDALLAADGAPVVRVREQTARSLERKGYLVPTDHTFATWSITERGRGAAAVLASVSRRRPADNPGLSAVKPYRETSSVVDAVCRLIRAVGRRIADEDTDGLELLTALDEALQAAWRDAIGGQRRTYTDGEIGRAVGITKQAVSKRWPRAGTTKEEGSP